MVSRLATDQVDIVIGNAGPVTLRPSLRAAIRLDRLHGIDTLGEAILAGNLGVIRSIIHEAADDDPTDLFVAMEYEPLGKVFAALAVPLLTFVMLLMGADPDDTPAAPAGKASSASSSTPFAWSRFYERLYGHAVAAFHWTPETTLDSTPAEIMIALDALKHTHAVAEAMAKGEPIPAYPGDEAQPYAEPILNPDGTDPAFDRSALHALRAKLGG